MANQLSLDQIVAMYDDAEVALKSLVAKAKSLMDEIAAVDWQINALPNLFEKTLPVGIEWVDQNARALEAAAKDAAWNAKHLTLGLLLRYWTTMPAHSTMFDTNYEFKKKFVARWNEYMREADAAFEHPVTKEPCLLLAVASRGEGGRFTLQSRITKKRSGSYKSAAELKGLQIMRDVPRKEGFIEKRKKDKKE